MYAPWRFRRRLSALALLGIGRLRCYVSNVDGLLRLKKTTQEVSRVRTWRIAPKIFAECRHRILQGDRAEHVAVESVQNAKISLADARCVLQHGLEYGLQLAR